MIRRGIAALMAALMLLSCGVTALADCALPADFLARTQTGVYFSMDDTLIRVDGDVAAKVAGGSFLSVATVGDTAYCLQYGEDYALDLVQYAPGSEPKTLYEFQSTDRVGNLTAWEGDLFVLLNDQLHVVYPSNGMCIKLANTAMSEYVWMNGTVYFIAKEETVTHTMESLLGGEGVKKAGGVLYSLDLNTGNMVLLYKNGVEDLRAGGDMLYFHDLSDGYVMGTETEEWLEGRAYRFDPAAKEKVRIVDGYDWGIYPMRSSVAVYTAEGVSVQQLDGSAVQIYQPQGVISAVSTDDALYIYDHTANALYRYDGKLSVMAEKSLGELMNQIGREVQEAIVPEEQAVATARPTAEPTEEPTEEPTAEPATAEPTAEPATAEPTAVAIVTVKPVATAKPTAIPTAVPATAEPTPLNDGTQKPVVTVKPTEKPAAQPTKNTAAMDGSYIFPDSDKRKLTREEIKAVDKDLWSYGRNEIYARHGYYFGDGNKYQKYFEKKSWYWAGDFSTSELNSIEWYNMELLKEMEGLKTAVSDKNNNSSSSSSSSSGTSSGYIFASSSKKKLTRKQILALDKSMWGYARNEIYARHGYSFKTAKYRNYFRKKSWYKEGGFSTGKLNSVEWYNMNLIKSMEKEYGVK